MFHWKKKVAIQNPDMYEPDQTADPNFNPAVGGVDWTQEASVADPPVPPVITKSRKFNPSERYFERNPEVLIDKPGVKRK